MDFIIEIIAFAFAILAGIRFGYYCAYRARRARDGATGRDGDAK